MWASAYVYSRILNVMAHGMHSFRRAVVLIEIIQPCGRHYVFVSHVTTWPCEDIPAR